MTIYQYGGAGPVIPSELCPCPVRFLSVRWCVIMARPQWAMTSQCVPSPCQDGSICPSHNKACNVGGLALIQDHQGV